MPIRPLLTLAAALALASCSTLRQDEPDEPRKPGEVAAQDVARVDKFFREGGKGGFVPSAESVPALTPDNSWFVADLDAQRLYFYGSGKLLAASTLSSGRKYYRTETGNYTLGQKDLNHRSSSYGNFVRNGRTLVSDVKAGFDPQPPGAKFQGALMKYFMRFHRNGQPTAMGFHQGALPGYPASHGCVRLPGGVAKWLFEHAPMQTPIHVRGSKLGIPYGASQNRPSRKPKVHSSVTEARKAAAAKKEAEPPAADTPPDSASDSPAPAPSPADSEPAAPPPAAPPAPSPADSPAPPPPADPSPAPSPDLN